MSAVRSKGAGRKRKSGMRKDDGAVYVSPLVRRYAGPKMASVFGERERTLAWRDLWIALADVERRLGLEITEAQVKEMKRRRDDIDFKRIAKFEKEFRHDVMAHVHAFGVLCPKARPIIHLGATSAFVTDNGDLIILRKALRILLDKLVLLCRDLSDFAMKYRGLPCLGFTHFQPAQPTTVGKRATLWLYDFLRDLERVEDVLENLPFRGAKGTTGTQESFIKLFGGKASKVKELDRRLAKSLGFKNLLPVCGQVYTRKIDTEILQAVAGVGESAAKMANDIRLLQHLQELEEPFEKRQIGSSAMAYKRNPMRCERMSSLSRFLCSLPAVASQTAQTQWLERTLDDSAARRIILPEAFLTADAVLNLAHNVVSGLVVNERVIERRLQEYLPLFATEEVLMAAVRKGHDRQDVHEVIRRVAHEEIRLVREKGKKNATLERLADEGIIDWDDVVRLKRDPAAFTGRASAQVAEFLMEVVHPVLSRHARVKVHPDKVEV